MAYTLTPGISCCVVDGVAVFLDVNADRYFALGSSASQNFIAAAEGDSPAAQRHSAIDDLLKRGIMREVEDRSPASLITAALPADSSALDGDVVPCTIGNLVRSANAVALSAISLRRQPLSDTLAAATRRSVAGCDAAPALIEAARRFDSARCYLPFARSCLRDSVALLFYLRTLPERPRIVFGVRLDPFRAHCWIQHQATLLNETVDHARLFTPILIR